MASILQSFHILFESNVDKVRVGEETLKKVDKDLEGQFIKTGEAGKRAGRQIAEGNAEAEGSFKALEVAVDKFKESTLEAFSDIAKSFIGIFAFESVADNLFETADMVEHLGQVADSLGVNVSDLDAWGRAVKATGGTVEGFEESLRGLNRRLTMLTIGGRGAEMVSRVFKEIGISATDAHGKALPLMQLLPELAAKFQTMSRQESAGIGQRLGLDPATILLLQSGQKAVQDLIDKQKELGVVTDQDVKIAAEFEDQWRDTKQLFTEGSIQIGDVVLPVITEALKLFQELYEYLGSHTELVKGFFVGVATIVGGIYAPAMYRAAVATIAATYPFILIGLAVAAFALIFEDAMDYLEGKKSVIGELAAKWPPLGVAVRDVAAVIVAAKDVIVGAFGLIVEAFTNPRKAAADFVRDMQPVIDIFTNGYDKLNTFLSKLLNFPNVLGSAATSIVQDIESVFHAFASFIDFIWGKIKPILDDIIAGAKAIGSIIGRSTGPNETQANIAKDTSQTQSLPAVQAARAQAAAAQPGYKAPDTDDAGYNVIGTGNPPWQGPGSLPGHPNVMMPGSGANPLAAYPSGQIGAAQAAMARADSDPTNPLSITGAAAAGAKAGQATSNTTVNADVNVTVNTNATDPQAVAAQVNDTLGKHLQNLINHHNDGVSG